MKTKTWVRAENGWVNTNEVIFIDIEEGPAGDEMSFRHDGKQHKSIIVCGSCPG